ncbi:MAG: thiamine phosphate synthase [Gammaproteobacteria bacterium]
MHRKRLHGLYAITDATPRPWTELVRLCDAILRGGASVLQYRDKSAETALRRKTAGALLEICNAHDALLIINDDVQLAAAVGAHGVHLGRDDTSLQEAREQLGEEAVIGISCYNQLERAEAAAAGGADYLAFGSFFPSPTKPRAVRATPDLLGEAKRRFSLPLVAIGGITPENGATLVQAGADMLAVISGVFQQPDPRQAATRYCRLFEDRQPASTGAQGRKST